MAVRAEHVPTHRERVVLQKLSAGAEMPSTKLDPTAAGRTLSKLLAKGWIERGASRRHYRITQLGEAALRAPIP
jgi:DNA-binding PadR family transcriptional regulator